MGAFSPQGFYRYPEERLLAQACGVRELGRRMLAEPSIRIEANGTSYTLAASDWTSPMADSSAGIARADADAADPSASTGMPEVSAGGSKGDIGSSLYRSVRLGKGTVVLVGSYLGNGYKNQKAAVGMGGAGSGPTGSAAAGAVATGTSASGSADGAGSGFLRWLEDTAATAGVHAPVVLNAPAARSGGAAGASGAASPGGAADRFPLFAKLGWGTSEASGGAGGLRRRAAFLFLPGTDASYELTIRDPALIGCKVRELVTDTELAITEKGSVRIPGTPWGVAILMA
jgi:hypothetical protein